MRPAIDVIVEEFEAELAAVFLSRVGRDAFPATVIEKHWQECAQTYVRYARRGASTEEEHERIARAIDALNNVHGGWAWPEWEPARR